MSAAPSINGAMSQRFTSIVAEQSLLGALLLDSSQWRRVAPLVRTEDISRPDHRLILGALIAVASSGRSCDPVTIADWLERTGKLEEAGGLAYLSELARTTPGAINVVEYALIVRDRASRRRLREGLEDSTDLPGLYQRELARFQVAPATTAPAAPFEVRRLDETTTEPRRAIVQSLGLDEAAVVAIVGSPNAGKTAFAVSLALPVAGRVESWLGLKVAGGPVVYFGAEAPASVKMRARAAVSRLELPRAPAFYVTDAVPAIGGELTAEVDAERIIATIQAVSSAEGERVLLAFIDTLASCLGDGDENGDGMLRLVAAAKLIAARTGCCVVLIHHPSKGDGASLRGHGSLSAACDSIIRIDVEELTGVRTATLVKARDHATGLQLRFELEPVTLPERDSFGDPYTTVVVRASGQAAPRPRPSGQRQRELLTELERRHRIGERQWDEATVCKAGRDLGMHRNSPRDALRSLIKSGYLTGSSMSLSLKFPPEGPA